tara:strand:- start:336 stop:1157 length:822 start_codon:yes stop_codon:yes gene_type:complete
MSDELTKKLGKAASAAVAAYRAKRKKIKQQRQTKRETTPNPDAAIYYQYDKGSKLRKQHKDMFRAENPSVSNLIRHSDDSNNRTAFTDTYDDDGRITWFTGSKKGTPERRQEKRTLRQLEMLTGLDFKRTGRKGKADIQIKRFGNNNKYFDRKYAGEDWYNNMQNTTGAPGGLHHYNWRETEKGFSPFSRIEVPKFKAKMGENLGRYGKFSQNTLSHELGHALGLRDLATPEEQAKAANYSVMGYNTSQQLAKGKNRFSKADIQAIMQNYGLA